VGGGVGEVADCLREAIISNIWLMVGGGSDDSWGFWGDECSRVGGYAQTSTVGCQA